jgi:hypothetical protein
MIMKKLIAFAVVFTLVAVGVAFADLGAQVIGTVNLFEGSTVEDSEKTGSASFNRLRIEGSGENDDGNFGAWIRFEGLGLAYQQGDLTGHPWENDGARFPQVFGLAWWKPIDQFKLVIGGNPDGIYGKEGYAGWMFKQTANDTGVVSADQAWTCDYTVGGEKFRDAFYGGFGGNGLMLEIKPVDMFGLNIVLPYFVNPSWNWGAGEWEDGDNRVGTIFKNMTIQVDLNLDFGNIALTADLHSRSYEELNDKIGGDIFFYFGLSAVENLSLDFSIGFGLPEKDVWDNSTMRNMGIGLAAKYQINDQFGLKARVLAELMGGTTPKSGDKVKDPTNIIFDILPFFSISDRVTIFADIGINMATHADWDNSLFGFHFNPYVQVGNEWGPSFFAGIKVWTKGRADGDYNFVDDKGVIRFAVPIALSVSL